MRHAMTVAMTTGVLLGAASAKAQVFTTKGAFLNNVQPGFYEEAFTNVPTAFVQQIDLGPVNGFAYSVTAFEGLFNDVGVVGANSSLDPLEITFTGATITAVGGNFYATDLAFNTIPVNITIELSNGVKETFFSNWSGDFRGFTSAVPITKITIDADDTVQDAWAMMDNLIVGVSTGSSCYPDCDGSGTLDIDDFICFQTFFAIADPYADCDASGSLDIDDFICFQTFFAIGC